METLFNSAVSDSFEGFAKFEQGYEKVKEGEIGKKQEIVRVKVVAGGKTPHDMNRNKDNGNDEPHVKKHKNDKKVNGEKWAYMVATNPGIER